MTPSFIRLTCRLAAIGALVAALGLAACGRKGPLDLPPGAAADPAVSAAPPDPAPAQQQSLIGGYGQQSSAPVAPKGPKKRIPLDVLLD